MLGKVHTSPLWAALIAAVWLFAGTAGAEAMGHDHAMHGHLGSDHSAHAAAPSHAGHNHDLNHTQAPADASTALAREVKQVQNASSGAVCPHGKAGPCVCHLLRTRHSGCCLKACDHAPQEPNGASLAPMIEQAVMERSQTPIQFVQTAFLMNGVLHYPARRSAPDPRPPAL